MRKLLVAAVSFCLSLGLVAPASALYLGDADLDLTITIVAGSDSYVHEFALDFTCGAGSEITFTGSGEHGMVGGSREPTEYISGSLDVGASARSFTFNAFTDSARTIPYFDVSGELEGSATSGDILIINTTWNGNDVFGDFFHVPDCETQQVTREVSTGPAPSATFQGASGGDGFNAIPFQGRIYSVFHHNNTFNVACLMQSDGSTCPDAGENSWPIMIAQVGSHSIGTQMSSTGFINPQGTKLYAYAVDRGISGGVMCLDLATGDSCGYTSLTTVSGTEVPISTTSLSDDWGGPARVGDRIYAAFGDLTTAYQACFDMQAGTQCAGYPVALTGLGSSAQRPGFYLQGPRSVAYGSRVYSTVYDYSTAQYKITCLDTTTDDLCGGENTQWPRLALVPWGVLPLLNTDGSYSTICSVYGPLSLCFDAVTGANSAQDFPDFLYPASDAMAFFGQGRIVGSRLIFNAGSTETSPQVDCLDFAGGTPVSCGSVSFPNAVLTYALDPDPARSGCFWINSDRGTNQIQNFDAITMTLGCGSKPRIARTDFAPDVEGCAVVAWDSVEVTTPDAWTSASVTVIDHNGTPLANGESLTLTAGSATDLSGVTFGSEKDPSFVFTFDPGVDVSGGITATFKYQTAVHERCKTSKPVVYAVPRNVSLTYGDSAPASYLVDYYTNLAHTTGFAGTLTKHPACSMPFYLTSADVDTYAGYVTCVANSTAANTDPTYFIDVEAVGSLTVTKATGAIDYTGTEGSQTLGGSLTLTSDLAPSACSGLRTYTLDKNPTDGTAGTYTLGASPVSTSGWQAGSYTIKVSYSGDHNCTSDDDTASLTLSKRTSTVGYTGTSGSKVIGDAVTLSSTLSPAECTGARTYKLDKNPTDGTSGDYTLGASPVTTTDWLPDTYTITASYAASGDCAGDDDTATLTMGKATPTVTYGGTTGTVTIGNNISLSSTLSPAFCSGSVTYSITPDPTTGTGSLSLTSSPVATTGWAAGIYTITASYAGDSRCNSRSDSVLVTLNNGGDPGNGTYGGGWYRTSGVRVNFGHVVTSTSTTDKRTGNITTVYKGQVLWMSRNGWRLKGSISSTLVKNGSTVLSGSAAWLKTSCPSSPTVGATGSKPVCGYFTGTATLQKWDWTLNGGLGGWANSSYGTVTFTVTIYDGGKLTTCAKNVCKTSELTDYFGISIGGLNPADLVPTSAPVALTSSTGNGTVRAG